MGLVEEYVAGDNLVPVSDLVLTAKDIEERYLPWTVQRGKKGNDYYGLPLDVQTLLIYRNNKLYKEAGLDPKAPFKDLNDLYEQSVKLTKKKGGLTDQVGCNTNYYCAFQTILFQQFLQREKNGTPWVDASTNKLVWPKYPEIFDLFEWFCKLSTETDDSAFMTGQNRFALGKAGMKLDHPVAAAPSRSRRPTWSTPSYPSHRARPGHQPYTAGSHWMWVVGKWAPDLEIGLEVGVLLHQQAGADRVERHRRRPAQPQGTGGRPEIPSRTKTTRS